jgi:hypothetical protein
MPCLIELEARHLGGRRSPRLDRRSAWVAVSASIVIAARSQSGSSIAANSQSINCRRPSAQRRKLAGLGSIWQGDARHRMARQCRSDRVQALAQIAHARRRCEVEIEIDRLEQALPKRESGWRRGAGG